MATRVKILALGLALLAACADLPPEAPGAGDAGSDAATALGEGEQALTGVSRIDPGLLTDVSIIKKGVIFDPGRDWFPFFCGDLNQACCAAYDRNPSWGPHCNTGFGCDQATNTCVACGQPGGVCCDGPQTCASGLCYTPSPVEPNATVMCFTGRCEASTHRCEQCGSRPGAACCAPDTQIAVANCPGDHVQCDFAQGWGGGTCQSCGHVNEPSCHGDCDAHSTDVGGVCQPCGAGGQASCNGICDAGTVRVASGAMSDVCQPCGGANQLACAGNVCNSDRLNPISDDRGKTYYCRPCGDDNGLSCFQGEVCNRPDLVKNGTGYCVHCGGCRRPICTAKGMSACESSLHSDNNICYTEANGSCPKNPPSDPKPGDPKPGDPKPGDPKPPACECGPGSSDPACGGLFGEMCSDMAPCRPGMGCTGDLNGQGPFRCRTPEPWESWKCPPVDANGCWTKKDVGNCHVPKKADK